MDLTRNRTMICSVVFLDIVGYSRLSVARQQRVKRAFNAVVADAIARLPEDERIILDTGDGAALCFVGDPEDALFVSLDLRNAFGGMAADEGEAYPGVRIGINLGPVRAVQDLNGRTNLIGDGINVGQRIMSFCEPDQILVARSYFEVVGCLSTKHAALFRFHGARQDKHVREHVMYEVHLEAAAADDEGVEAPAVALEVAPAAEASLDEALLAELEAALTHEIGPLARVLVRRAAGTPPDALLDVLAAAIPEGPSREAYLARFAPRLDAAGRAPSAAPPAERGAPTAASEAHEPDGPPWTDGDRAAAQQALAAYLGPLARVLVQRAAERCRTRDAFLAELARELPSERERAAFLTLVEDAAAR